MKPGRGRPGQDSVAAAVQSASPFTPALVRRGGAKAHTTSLVLG